MIEADAPSTGGCTCAWRVRTTPGVVMVSPLALVRNAEGAQSEGRARHDGGLAQPVRRARVVQRGGTDEFHPWARRLRL
jgi:hypothetical protein